MPEQTFRKIPVEIQAVQFEGTVESANRVLGWIGSNRAEARRAHSRQSEEGLIISTLEGDMHALPGDWIIRGVKGEFYPCKPDIFAQTYSLVEDDDTRPETSEEPLTDPRPYSDPNSAEDIDNRFNYHPPTPAKVAAHESTRAAARELAHLFDRTLPPGREKSLSLTQLELALFWANAAIARHS